MADRVKRQARRQRAEDFWWEPSYAPTSHGGVHDLGDSVEHERSPAVIWVPDPEQRNGWREHWVRGDEKPKKRGMGF